MELINNNIKILLLGDINVGKTSLLNSFITNIFEQKISPTIGLDFKSKLLEGTNLKIFDSSGQEHFGIILNSYYRNIDIIIFVFSLDNIITLNNIEKIWIPNAITKYNENNIPKFILVGNKHDNNLDNEILYNIKKIKEKYNMDYYNVSAKTLYNIKYLFDDITRNYIINKKYILIDTINKQNSNIIINKYNENENENKNKNDLCCVIV